MNQSRPEPSIARVAAELLTFGCVSHFHVAVRAFSLEGVPMRRTPEEVHEIARWVARLPNVTVEVCGLWVWAAFDGKPDAQTRACLKFSGFRWARKKAKWYYAGKPCGGNRRPATMQHIRMTYGSELIEEVT